MRGELKASVLPSMKAYFVFDRRVFVLVRDCLPSQVCSAEKARFNVGRAPLSAVHENVLILCITASQFVIEKSLP